MHVHHLTPKNIIRNKHEIHFKNEFIIVDKERYRDDETKQAYLETIKLARTLEAESQKLHKQLGGLIYTDERVVDLQNQLYKVQLTQAALSITLAEMLNDYLTAQS